MNDICSQFVCSMHTHNNVEATITTTKPTAAEYKDDIILLLMLTIMMTMSLSCGINQTENHHSTLNCEAKLSVCCDIQITEYSLKLYKHVENFQKKKKNVQKKLNKKLKVI